MEDLKKFLINEVLLFESDTLPADTEKRLQEIRRERTSKPVIFISSGTAGLIAGAGKTFQAAQAFIGDNEPGAEIVLPLIHF